MKINIHSITTKTILTIVFSALIFVLFLTLVVKNVFSNAYSQQEKEKVTLLATTITPEIALNLSYGFQEAVTEIAKETLKNKNVLLIQVETNSTQDLLIYTQNSTTLQEYINNGEFIHYAQLRDPATKESIGKLTIVYSKAQYKKYMQEFTFWFVIGIFTFIVATFVMSYLLYNALKKLSYLDDALKSFDPNNPKRLPLIHTTKDEIFSITMSANTMIDNIISFLNHSKELTQELLVSQAHLKIAQRMAKVGSVELDLQTNKLVLSDEYYRILQLRKNTQLTWKEFLKIVSPKDYRYCKNSIFYALRHGSKFELKYSILLKDNKELHIQTKGKVRKKQDGSTKITAISMDITEDVENKKTIEKLAYFDALTGLANRTLLNDRMQKAIQVAKREKTQLAIIFLDLDHFKLINDTLGHGVGDELLIYISELLQNQVRESDTISRLGGDEFIVLLPSIKHKEDVTQIAQKIQAALQDKHQIGTHQLYITSSIGCAIYPDHGLDSDTLIRNADTAMYEAKNNGRNRFKVYSDLMGNYVDKQLNLEQDLVEAVNSKSQIEVYYQVKIDTKSKRVIGAEALVRWNHPKQGLIYPDDFVYMAESTGLMVELGNIIIEQSIQTLKELNNLGYRDFMMSINLSARQFQDTSLIPFITEILHKYKIDPKQVEFEITESISMSNMTNTLRILSDLRALNVSIAIDDFGTGHSSLAYLKKFPINTLKIDKSFVMDIAENEEDRVIAQTIIFMSHSLGMTTVAEGVETQEHVAILEEMGCDTLQGYFYSKPVKKENFLEFLHHYKKESTSE